MPTLQFADHGKLSGVGGRAILAPFDQGRPAWDREIRALDFDQIQRYSIVTQILSRLLTCCASPARVLEVGSNLLNLLPRFLPRGRIHVTRCDVVPVSVDDPDFVLIDPDKPLPFAAESFDAVVALEVLEHMPSDRRRSFVADCVRVARQGTVFTCPNGIPEVIDAERLAAAAFEQRQGRPHPFLREHRQFGLPREEDVTAYLRELGHPFAVFDNAPLDVWLPMLLLTETLVERQGPDELRGRFNQPLLQGRLQGSAVTYRKVYVCAKTFDATLALEPLPAQAPRTPAASESERRAGAAPSPDGPAAGTDLIEALAPTQWLATVVSDALNALLQDHQCEIETLNRQRDALVREHEEEQAFRQQQIFALTDTLQKCESEQQAWGCQRLVWDSFWSGLTRSWAWKLVGGLRALRDLVAPRRYDARDLVPGNDLRLVEGAEPGMWQSLGYDPQFILPRFLPAGWVRIRLKMYTAIASNVEFLIDTGHGFNAEECIERFVVGTGVEREFFVYLRRPVLGLRFDPLEHLGEFQLVELSIEPLSRPRALTSALANKVRLLREHRVLGRSLARGLTMLGKGQLSRFVDKIYLGQRTELERQDCQRQLSLSEYEAWREARALTDADRARLRAEGLALTDPPRISVIMPVYNCPEPFLRRAIESVLAQTYPHWELCIADDHSTNPHVRPLLEAYARREPRVRLAFRPERGNISAASNAALELASGDYVALLDHDDELAEHALSLVAKTLVADRGLDMVYSDEDKLEVDGRHVDPFFKPDWSPEYFLSCMYTCHLGVYRASLVREIGGFRSAFDTAQDYDLALRVVARTARIAHIPDVLYHWRKHPSSTAANYGSKPEAYEAARRALVSYLEITGQKGTVGPGPVHGFHRVRFDILGNPTISMVIPTGCRETTVRGKKTTFIAQCVASIRSKSTYDTYEIIVVDNGDMPPALARELDALGVRRVTYTEPFNLAAKMNLGAAQASGEHLLFLNDDVEVITEDWLQCFLEFSQQEGVGAVGAKLLFPNGRLQHVGVTILRGMPGHHFYNSLGHHRGYYCSHVVARNYSAVTGACLMTRAKVFRETGGFSPAFTVNYNDIDYCLRVVQGGRRIVYTPHARLYHHESASRSPGVSDHEVKLFRELWGQRWQRDPYYNPNLTARYNDYRIRTALELEADRLQETSSEGKSQP